MLGAEYTCNLTGNHTVNNYKMEVVYYDSSKICLLGKTSVATADWYTACNYRWTATFTSGSSKTVTNVKIPTLDEISSQCANFKTGFSFWTSSSWQFGSWMVYGAMGYISSTGADSSTSILPYVTITL